MADDQNVGIGFLGSFEHRFDLGHSFVEAHHVLGADGARKRRADMRDDDVGAGFGHGDSLGGIEHVRRGQQIHLGRNADHFHLLVIAHAGLFHIGADAALE